MLRYVFAVTVSLFAFMGPTLAQSAGPAGAAAAASSPASITEDVKTGDRWIYEVRDEITGEVKSTVTHVVTDITKSEINVRLSVSGSPNSGYITFDRSWNVKDDGTWRSTPHDGSGIRLPLEVGKTWSYQSNDVNSTRGFSAKRSVRSKIAAQESVTTRAGTFDTFKIEETRSLASSNDPTKKIQIVQQSWYAPEINHWVKRTFVSRSEGRVRENFSMELIEHGRR